jgi:hypothetical protein
MINLNLNTMKTINLLLIFLFFSTILTAQNETTDNREQLQFGVRAGISYSNVYDEHGDGFVADGKVGAAAGAVLSIPIGRYLGFQPEAMFVQKGFQGDANYQGKPYSLTRTTNHIDFPLQLKFNPAKNFSVLGGPQYSFLLSKKDEFDMGNLTVIDEDHIKNDKIQNNTFGLIFGLEFNFNKVTLTGKTGWDLEKNNDDGSTTNPRYKNQWLMFTLGLNL